MNLWRKIGIGIVSMIPAFVLSGLIWDMSHSWLSVFATIVIEASCHIFSMKSGEKSINFVKSFPRRGAFQPIARAL